jgi:uncharacterized protein (DUF58 family)
LLLFSDTAECFIPPKKGLRHVLRVVREVLAAEPRGRGTNIEQALQYLTRMLHRRSVIFLLSDFFDEREFKSTLNLINKRHDVIAVHLIDPRQEFLPNIGWLRLRDAEQDTQVLINAGKSAVRTRYAALAREHGQRLKRLCGSVGVDVVEIRSGQSYVDPLVRFFQARALRR